MQALGALSEHYDWKRIAVVYNSDDVWASIVCANTLAASEAQTSSLLYTTAILFQS